MVKKAKKVRKTLAERIALAEIAAFKTGYAEGGAEVRREYGPESEPKAALNDVVRTIESWPLRDDGVVFICGTDLKHGGSLSLPVRTMRAIARQLRRLGYSNAVE